MGFEHWTTSNKWKGLLQVLHSGFNAQLGDFDLASRQHRLAQISPPAKRMRSPMVCMG
jgi:hypothetical protein